MAGSLRLSRTQTFVLLVWINMINFCDRGIIPGSFQEFSVFVDHSHDSFGASPSTQLGFLQSAFIIGLIAGFSGFGHAVHHVDNVFKLTGIGCGVWILAVLLSGISYYVNSFVCLLIARILSGFGEASLQCTIPPWIQVCAPSDQKGVWLALFFTAIPVGTAIGYAYSSSMSSGPGWAWAFFYEAFVALPFVTALFGLHDDSGIGGGAAHSQRSLSIEIMSVGIEIENPMTLVGLDDSTTSQKDITLSEVEYTPLSSMPTTTHDVQSVTWKEEFWAVVDRPVYVCIVCGYASQVAVLIGLSTFGSAFIMGLGYYDSETEASTLFGVLASFAGIVGTPLGGIVLDVLARRSHLHLGSDSIGHSTSSSKEKTMSQQEAQLVDEICILIYWTSLMGMLMLTGVYFSLPKTPFFLIITTGCILLFMTAGAVNMAIMISIPVRHRAFGIALASICGHIFGDVPSPAIAGFIKDSLAPSCASDSSSDACRSEAPGLRWCMLLLVLWLYWSVLFFFAAWHFNQKELTRNQRY